MKRTIFLMLFFHFIVISAQSSSFIFIDSLATSDNAPNSYIFDKDKAKKENLVGIKIPVAKAFYMWKKNKYLADETLPEGVLSTQIIWEDVSGLISSHLVDQNGEKSIMEIRINMSKGKGNAVIGLKIAKTIIWSWHIWVTDDPTEETITYSNSLTYRFMDRNLGAIKDSLENKNNKNRAKGLMYQWGRKDPFIYEFFTGQIYKPNEEIEKKKLFGTIYFIRPFDDIKDNLKASINNPSVFYTLHSENAVVEKDNPTKSHWFSKTRFQENGDNFDLWADNTQGKKNIKIYEIQQKSPFDPCPNGWRVPSFSSFTVCNDENITIDELNDSQVFLWGATLNNEGYAYSIHINDSLGTDTDQEKIPFIIKYQETTQGKPVRCVKDTKMNHSFETIYIKGSAIEDKKIQIISNPNHGVFKIVLKDIFEEGCISIYDLRGGLVLSKEINGQSEFDFDIRDKSNGIYIVKITTKDKTFIEKIIKI